MRANVDSYELFDEVAKKLLALKEGHVFAYDSRHSTDVPSLEMQTCGFNQELSPYTNYRTVQRENCLNNYGLTKEQWSRSNCELAVFCVSEARITQLFIRPTAAEIGIGCKYTIGKAVSNESGNDDSDSEDKGRGKGNEQEVNELEVWIELFLFFHKWKLLDKAQDFVLTDSDGKRELDKAKIGDQGCKLRSPQCRIRTRAVWQAQVFFYHRQERQGGEY